MLFSPHLQITHFSVYISDSLGLGYAQEPTFGDLDIGCPVNVTLKNSRYDIELNWEGKWVGRDNGKRRLFS